MVYSKDDPGDLADESAIVLLLDIGDQQVEGAGTLNRELVALSLGVSVDDDDSHDQEHDKKYPSPLCMKIALSMSMWCFLSMAGSPALLGS